MEKYILELIKENNRVIIPNFGAFIISKENGVSILFNNFLSFNDGLLVNYVAEKKDIDTITSTDQVFDYVDNLKKELDEKGEYSISGLGVFKKDENGILRFQQDVEFGTVDEHAESLEEEEVKESQDEEVSDLLDIDKEEPIFEASEEEPESDEPKKDSAEVEFDSPIFTIDEEENKEIEHTHVAGYSEPKVEADKERSTISETSDIVTGTNKKEVNEYVQETVRARKRRNMITFLVIAFVVIISVAGYFIFFNKPKKVKVIPKPVVVQPVVKDSVKIDTVAIVKPKPEVKEVETSTEVELPRNEICIIVGGFKEENNAIKLVEKLKESGYENARIIPRGTMFLVSIDSDKSYRKMEARQQQILEKEKMSSWMYTIK